MEECSVLVDQSCGLPYEMDYLARFLFLKCDNRQEVVRPYAKF